jgi:excisionase family DNA binding protein
MEVFTIEEVAEILKVSVDTIRRMIKSGELEAFKVHRQYRIRKEVLERIMQTEPSQEQPKQQS